MVYDWFASHWKCKCDRISIVNGCIGYIQVGSDSWQVLCHNESCSKNCHAIGLLDIPEGKENAVPVCTCEK